MPGDPEFLRARDKILRAGQEDVEDPETAIALCDELLKELSWADAKDDAVTQAGRSLGRGVNVVAQAFSSWKDYARWHEALSQLARTADKALAFHDRGFRFEINPAKGTFSWTDSDGRHLFSVLHQWRHDVESAKALPIMDQKVMACWRGQFDRRLKTPDVVCLTGYRVGSVGKVLARLTHELRFLDGLPREGYRPSPAGKTVIQHYRSTRYIFPGKRKR